MEIVVRIVRKYSYQHHSAEGTHRKLTNDITKEAGP